MSKFYHHRGKNLNQFEETVLNLTDNLKGSACQVIEQQIQLLEYKESKFLWKNKGNMTNISENDQ